MRIGGEERFLAAEDAGLYREALGAGPPGGPLATLRKEVEPADQRALARLLPAWQGVDASPLGGAGIDRLREILVPLQGLALTPEVWERDVLPRRVGAYSQAWMDQLCASGELVWIGAGALGRNSGRVALYFREDIRWL